MMPLLRQSVYAQNVNLYLAPTADARDTWLPLMRTVACESRAFVLSANQCIKQKDLPDWIDSSQMSQPSMPREASGDGASSRRRSMITKTSEDHEITWPGKDTNGIVGEANETHIGTELAAKSSKAAGSDEFASRGGSCIVGPMGQVLKGPLWDMDEGEGSLLYRTVDFNDCTRGRLDFDAAGSYSRNDAFQLTVEGLDLAPPL